MFVFFSFCMGQQNSWSIFHNRIAKASGLSQFRCILLWLYRELLRTYLIPAQKLQYIHVYDLHVFLQLFQSVILHLCMVSIRRFQKIDDIFCHKGKKLHFAVPHIIPPLIDAGTVYITCPTCRCTLQVVFILSFHY